MKGEHFMQTEYCINKLTKSQMTDILSVFKKALMLGTRFTLSNDIIVIPTQYTTVNGVHCIKHCIDMPYDDYTRYANYISTLNIEQTIKKLTDAKNIGLIEMRWSPHSIEIYMEPKNDEPFTETLMVTGSPTAATSLGTLLPEQYYYNNIYDTISDSSYRHFDLNDEQLRNMSLGRVIELKDHDDAIIRISKNLFPCIGPVRKGTVPNMKVRVFTYKKNENYILALLTKYKNFDAAHVYYYDPIMPE